MAGPATADGPVAYRAALVAATRSLLERQDWNQAGGAIEKDIGFFTVMTEARALALAQRFLSAEAQANAASIRLTAATIAVAQRSLYALIVPNGEAFKEAYEAAITAHRPIGGRPAAPVGGIWNERSIVLDSAATLTPVVVAVWDAGVDTDVFKDRLWQNQLERANGRDNDGNGYAADLHGIGFTHDAERASDLLPRLSEDGRRVMADQLALFKGRADAKPAVRPRRPQRFSSDKRNKRPRRHNRWRLSAGRWNFSSAVTNLAAKILAVNPSLSVSQVIALIREGATLGPDGRTKLIHPRRTIELARRSLGVGR